MIDPTRLRRCYDTTREHLLAERNAHGHWEGELSTSALATATAVMALELVRRSTVEQPDRHAVRSGGGSPEVGASESDSTPTRPRGGPARLDTLVERGLKWLATNQNPDGGWGDTTKSLSNISTSMLARAVFRATGTEERHRDVVDRAVAYIDEIGGVDAVLERYGKDQTFSIPILTHCALAGLVEWKQVAPLPFELACLPARFYKTVRLPVVSYALPALIAIGQVRHHHRKPWNPITRSIRNLARKKSLRVLERIQPTNGGFLEATPLTSFVTMSLAGMGLAEHPVARKGVEFIVGSVREDGSWPIDTNLATWVTTLSINALGPDLPDEARPALRDWLLGQQYKTVHPYTNADPGGWAWTDLPGGVPDADDTPGAMLALCESSSDEQQPDCHAVRSRPEARDNSESKGTPTPTGPRGGPAVVDALERAATWLVSLQNRDGGFPTFCRGWGNLPFDRSSADITAHALRAIAAPLGGGASKWVRMVAGGRWPSVRFRLGRGYPFLGALRSILKGFRYLARAQRPDGSWYPLWFGNQHDPEEENPTYGTAKVLAAYRDCGRIETEPARRGLEWLRANQNDDGGWGGRKGIASSVEETALATELLVSVEPQTDAAKRGVAWLLDRVDQQSDCHAVRPERSEPNRLDEDSRLARGGLRGSPATWTTPTPIGFYFAKLWYFERLYPIAFTVGALRRAVAAYADGPAPEMSDAEPQP